MDEFNTATSALIHHLEKGLEKSSCRESEVDIADLFGKATLDVIAKVAFGLNLNSGTYGFITDGYFLFSILLTSR